MTRLQASDPARYEWVASQTWTGAIDAVRTRSFDVAVLDPLAGEEDGVACIEEIHAQFPSLPLVVYTTLSASMASTLLRLGQIGIRRVVFAVFEDAPAALRQILRKEIEWGAARQIITTLQTVLAGLPTNVQFALEASLRTPEHRATTAQLAERAHLSVYECTQLFTKAGLPTPYIVMILARLLYAHRLLLDPGHTIEAVARKLGYKRVRTLQSQFQAVFGRTGAELRTSLSPTEAAETVMRYCSLHSVGAHVNLDPVPG